jgi:hypothetical protein
MALSKESILKHSGMLTTGEVHVPAWADDTGDDVVLVRGMTIREFELNQARAVDGTSTASLLARCIVDSTGGRVFADDDIPRIAELGFGEINRIADEIAELSGLGEDAKKAAEGKSEAPPSGSSDSPSPES